MVVEIHTGSYSYDEKNRRVGDIFMIDGEKSVFRLRGKVRKLLGPLYATRISSFP